MSDYFKSLDTILRESQPSDPSYVYFILCIRVPIRDEDNQ